MILIVGLGNPGEKFLFTRHNIGFEIIDSFHLHFKFHTYKSKFDGLYSKKSLFGKDIIIFKPQNFMNLSGNPIKKLRNYFKIENTLDIILIHDDIDMEFLKPRVKANGGHGGHNGVRDVIKFNGKDFYRVKLGISNNQLKEKKVKPENFVLNKFDKSEREVIEEFKKLANKYFEYLVLKEFSLFKTRISESSYGV